MIELLVFAGVVGACLAVFMFSIYLGDKQRNGR